MRAPRSSPSGEPLPKDSHILPVARFSERRPCQMRTASAADHGMRRIPSRNSSVAASISLARRTSCSFVSVGISAMSRKYETSEPRSPERSLSFCVFSRSGRTRTRSTGSESITASSVSTPSSPSIPRGESSSRSSSCLATDRSSWGCFAKAAAQRPAPTARPFAAVRHSGSSVPRVAAPPPGGPRMAPRPAPDRAPRGAIPIGGPATRRGTTRARASPPSKQPIRVEKGCAADHRALHPQAATYGGYGAPSMGGNELFFCC